MCTFFVFRQAARVYHSVNRISVPREFLSPIQKHLISRPAKSTIAFPPSQVDRPPPPHVERPFMTLAVALFRASFAGVSGRNNGPEQWPPRTPKADSNAPSHSVECLPTSHSLWSGSGQNLLEPLGA